MSSRFPVCLVIGLQAGTCAMIKHYVFRMKRIVDPERCHPPSGHMRVVQHDPKGRDVTKRYPRVRMPPKTTVPGYKEHCRTFPDYKLVEESVRARQDAQGSFVYFDQYHELNVFLCFYEGLADNTPWICAHLRRRPGRMYHKGNRTNLQSFS